VAREGDPSREHRIWSNCPGNPVGVWPPSRLFGRPRRGREVLVPFRSSRCGARGGNRDFQAAAQGRDGRDLVNQLPAVVRGQLFHSLPAVVRAELSELGIAQEAFDPPSFRFRDQSIANRLAAIWLPILLIVIIFLMLIGCRKTAPRCHFWAIAGSTRCAEAARFSANACAAS